MKLTGLLTMAVAAMLVFSASAFADGAGHNPQTKKLEASFTSALTQRVDSANGCYPAPPRLARGIAKAKKIKTAVAANLKSVRTPGPVYVVRRGTSCNGVRLALKYKRVVYVLDSLVGEVRVIGRQRTGKDPAIIGNRGPLRALRLATTNVRMTVPHRRDRLEVKCPGKSFPLGGGMVTTPGLGADGEGVYPHSFERLGTQQGWHISGWLMDPSGGAKASRDVTVQAMCGKGLVPTSAPHRTTFVKPGETKSVAARCPGGEQLMSGGYQRTDFLGDGGDFITESRAAGSRAWTVSASAYGKYGGELTAIAYCVKAKGGPLLTEVTAAAPLAFGAAATATTPACPGDNRLTAGGFSLNGSNQAFFAGGSINADNTWSATGYGFFGPAPSLTAYGYCLQPGR